MAEKVKKRKVKGEDDESDEEDDGDSEEDAGEDEEEDEGESAGSEEASEGEEKESARDESDEEEAEIWKVSAILNVSLCRSLVLMLLNEGDESNNARGAARRRLVHGQRRPSLRLGR